MAKTELASASGGGEAPTLYAAREPIYPKAINGWFRRLKWWIMVVTLGVYYVTPWIRFPRGGDMPDQAVLVDMANRRFFFFWIEIWPQEFYYVAGLLIMAGLGLFLFTSALGRVWCGYACPQTVWVDLFLHVERWIDGDRNAQIRRARAPWSAKKIAARLSKWSIWLLIAVATGGAWVFYFADAPTLAVDLATGQAPFVAYATIGVLTATTFIFGGFMREQVCVYMCPWPRIQSAMLDENSLIVTYKDWRGEPRSKHRKGAKIAPEAQRAAVGAPQAEAAGSDTVLARLAEAAETGETPFGDCIDCNACVAVCPMGIDIRNGDQLECITCALCIDACDEMMKKVGKPRGLIDYATLVDCKEEKAGKPAAPVLSRILRPRTMLYFTLWSAIGVFMVVTLFMRDTIDLSVARDRNPLFVTLSDGAIRNGYSLRIANKNPEPRSFRLSLTGAEGLQLRMSEGDTTGFVVEADKLGQFRAFVTAAPDWRERVGEQDERVDIRFWLEDLVTRERTSVETVFVAP